MVTEREEKLAAARKKLARFQQTKTAGHQRPPSQQPKLESIGRGVEESNSSNDQTRNTSPDSLNGINPNPTHNLMYSNPTPTFEESGFHQLTNQYILVKTDASSRWSTSLYYPMRGIRTK